MLKDIPLKIILLAGFLFTGIFLVSVSVLISFSTTKEEIQKNLLDKMPYFVELNAFRISKTKDIKKVKRILKKMASEKYSKSFLIDKNGKIFICSSKHKTNNCKIEIWNKILNNHKKTGIFGVGENKFVFAFHKTVFNGKSYFLLKKSLLKGIQKQIDNSLRNKFILILLIALFVLIVVAIFVFSFIEKEIDNVVLEQEVVLNGVLNGDFSLDTNSHKVAYDFRKVMELISKFTDTLRIKTEKNKTLEELVNHHQKMEAIGTLAGGIAHDFNNILNYMMTYGEILEYELKDNDFALQNLKEMMSGIERASDLVSQIMLFSRKSKDKKQSVKFVLILKETLNLVKATFSKNIKIVKNIKDTELFIESDPTKIYQIIINIYTNAFHAMIPNGGTMTVSLEKVFLDKSNEFALKEGDYALFSVEDSGCGMEKDVLNRVFEPFFTTKPQGVGNGMGMSVVHGIIQEINGAIHIESEKNKGTKVFVYLPLSQRKNETIELQKNYKKIENLKILFVDDEEQICKSTTKILNQNGFVANYETSSLNALFMLGKESEKYDLVITDLNMPEMNGYEFCKKIKEKTNLPVIAITGFFSSNDFLTLFDAVLFKPYSKEDLIETISKLFI